MDMCYYIVDLLFIDLFVSDNTINILNSFAKKNIVFARYRLIQIAMIMVLLILKNSTSTL